MRPEAKSRRKERGVLLATAGLLTALLIAWVLRVLGLSEMTAGEWALALIVTVSLQSILWLIPHRGWDARLTWDPHYLYLPMVVAVFIMVLYLYLSPEIRDFVVMAWFASLLFVTGLAGFVEVLLISALMASGYLGTILLLAAQGGRFDLVREATVAGVILVVGLFAGLVLERIRRNRKEMKRLRTELDRLAHTDYLTELPNRRRFEETLTSELARVQRYGGSCAIGLLDVDRFKDFNDRYGHLAGDEILRQLGRILRTELRAGDLPARYGGEEFAILMVNTGREEAVGVLERLRHLVAAHSFHGVTEEVEGELTVSGGVAALPEDAEDAQELMGAADRALYRAKDQGRNRVLGVEDTGPPRTPASG